MKKLLITIITLGLAFNSGAQDLEPTSTEALVNVSTVNSSGEARAGEKVSFKAEDGQIWSVVTDGTGQAQLLVPKGASYKISYMTLEGDNDYSMIEIPNAEGKVQFDLKLEFEQPKVYTLKNVNFETGRSSVTSSSFPYLDQLVELMLIKGNMKIEIGGHTDNVGDAAKNEALSQQRADAVRSYLMNNGISGERVVAVGYGQDQPIASNDTNAGRQQNRRTEVRVITE